jgi:DNA-binding MarR family transcriptional regulator
MISPAATPPPAIYGQFGQALAYAERTLHAVLRDHLAERGVEPEAWYALHLTAIHAPRYARADLRRELEGNPYLDSDTARELLERLENLGLIRGDSEVELTARGDALHSELRDYISAPTARLLGQFDLRDIETTVRTLQKITELAAVAQ